LLPKGEFMRSAIASSPVLLVSLAAWAATSACIVTNDASTTTTAAAGRPGTTTSGTGGAGQGGGAAGGEGQGGAAPAPCGGVPVLGRCSADGTTMEACVVPMVPYSQPKIVQTTCAKGTACQTWKGTAACRPTGACFEGQSQCADAHTLEVCSGGAWTQTDCGGTACVATPGAGAACVAQDQGAGITLHGHLDYEFKKPNADLTDFTTEAFKEGAVDMFITVYEDGQLIGTGLTSPGDGTLKPGDFELKLSKAPTDKSYTYFWPMLFDDSGNPRMAVAKAKSTASASQTSDGYWSFGFETCKTPGACAGKDVDLGALLVDTAHDSGVVYLYQWIDYTTFRVEGSKSLGPGLMSLVALWAPGNQFDCGSCFNPPELGTPAVTYDAKQGLVDYYSAGLAVSGSDASPHEWSRSAINHELGHWVMHSYSTPQGGCGQDLLDQKSQMAPDVAYTEGFATFFGQTSISTDPTNNEPIAFLKGNGTVFWVDLGKLTTSSGKLPLPVMAGKLDQPINENVVAGMLWSLWAGANAIAPQKLGDDPMLSVLPSSRLLYGPDRGFQGTDLVDYLDAMLCTNAATAAQVTAVTKAAQLPYDGLPKCE
jgi:hypothetical protein